MLYKEETDVKKLFAGAVALLMCIGSFGALAGCKKDTHEHDFIYESVSATEHRITCSGCDYEEIREHNIEHTKIDVERHKITCKDCDLDETASHNCLYEYIDENSHNVTCELCDLDETTAHDYLYEYIDENSHNAKCEHCAQVDRTEVHIYSSDTDLECECSYTRDWFKLASADEKQAISAGGYVTDKISDFSQYAGTAAYRTVTTSSELIEAIKAAKCSYTSSWDADTQSVKQVLNAEGTVHVIEIANDIEMGFNKLEKQHQTTNGTVIENYSRRNASAISTFTMSDMFKEYGITKVKIENTNNLLIYSKNGAKLTHCGFSILSCDNVVFRNLEMDEMWQWEDSASSSTGKVGDYDAFGWAYFKVAHCGYVWIDHCTFGKSYDGQIDYSNPVYDTEGTAFRAPYGADGSNGLHISWCNFNAGSDDPDGYLYKMMAKIEEEYQAGGKNYLYYNALRAHYTFEQILYGVAIPQKKGFLCGDSGNGKSDYDMNLSLQISFSNCYFKNLEDRLPKLRGGNAVMYNCIVDSLQYINYRNQLSGAASYVTAVNSSWKCALVSQGIVCGNGGSFYGENCEFKGINTLLKNNDSGGITEGEIVRPVAGGFKMVNCTYQRDANSSVVTTFNDVANLTAANFVWRTENGEAPFEIKELELSELEDLLAHPWYGAGVNNVMQERLLKSNYGA